MSLSLSEMQMLKTKFQEQTSLDKMDLKHKSRKLALIFSKLSREELKNLTVRLTTIGVAGHPLTYSAEISVEMQRIWREIIYKHYIDKQAQSNRRPDQMLLNLKLIWLLARLEEEIQEVLEIKPLLGGTSVLHYLK